MSEGIRDFKDLIVWKKAMAMAKEVYVLTRLFPNEERFVLTAQIRRAAISVPSNIAEEHSRQGREYGHCLSIARGSLAESGKPTAIGCRLGLFVAGTGAKRLWDNMRDPQNVRCHQPKNKLRSFLGIIGIALVS